jgi:hypothetical protein
MTDRARLRELPVFRFLNGEASLDGSWYDDEPPPGRGRYWWRSDMLDALDAAERERDELGAKLVDAINLAAERTRERDELRALLAEARGYVQQEAEHGGYGFARPDNPHDFFPDQESCSPEEIANHKAACEAWGRGEYTPEAASGWISEDVHVTRAPWGIGSYTFRDPQATSLIARIDAALAEGKR